MGDQLEPIGSCDGCEPFLGNVFMESADDEYEYILPAGTVALHVKTRDGTAFRIGFRKGVVASATSTGHYTVLANDAYAVRGLVLQSDTRLYLACGSAGKTAEILGWKRG